MSQTDNDIPGGDFIDDLKKTLTGMEAFMNHLQNGLSDEQKSAVSEQLGGKGGFNATMAEVNKKMAEAMNLAKQL